MSDPQSNKNTAKPTGLPKLSRPYTMRKWSGLDVYRCDICGFDAWSQENFDNHKCNQHRAKDEDKQQ